MVGRVNTSLTSIAVGLALLAGIGLTVWGLVQMSWPSPPASFWDGLPLQATFPAAGVLLVVAISRLTGMNPLAAGGIAAGTIAVCTGTTWPLLVTLWFALASFGLGLSVLSALKIDKTMYVNAFLIGAGLYGTVVGLLAHFPVNYPGLYGLGLALPVVWGWRSLQEAIRPLSRSLQCSPEHKWLDLAIVLAGLVHFSVSLMPEVGNDALTMHLFVPGHLASRHEWGFNVTNYVWAAWPMLGDWIFSIGYMLGGEPAARLMNVGFIFVLGWMVRSLVIWAGGNAAGARWAVLLFLTTPLTFTESSSLFIESVWAAFVVAGSLSVLRLLRADDGQASDLLVAGFLSGCALAAKVMTCAILPVLLLLLLVRWRAWLRAGLLGSLAAGLVVFVAVGIVPYLTSWYYTHNPVFPFFKHIFPSPLLATVSFSAPAIFAQGITWDLFYQMTFHSEKFLEGNAGAAGFQWLVLFFPAFLMLVAPRPQKGAILFVTAILSVMMTFQSLGLAYLRYVFPSFAWAAAGIGAALSATCSASVFRRQSLLAAAGMVICLNCIFFKSGTYYGNLSLPPLLSQSGREAYLKNCLPIRNAIELVNQLNNRRKPVAVLAPPLTAGINSDILYPSWYNYSFKTQLDAANTPGDMARLFLEHGVDYIILDSHWWWSLQQGIDKAVFERFWGTLDKQKIVEEATERVAELGNITVRKIKHGYLFQTERIKNPDFASADGWVLSTESQVLQSGQAVVNVVATAYQQVAVSPGRRYLNTVTARCADQPGQGRVQVNWLDAKSQLVSTVIRVFDCSSTESTSAMEVDAPATAVTAVVYASGHSEKYITFKRVSFKQ